MRVIVLLTALLLAAAPAAAFDRSAAPDTVADWSGFQYRIHREGRVFVSGQPDSTALLELPDRGVTCVVNLRRPEEMEKRVDFDEAALLAELGVAYVSIPLGGDDHPYTPAAVDAFAAALAEHDGNILLHCTAAWRASHLWSAYLVKYHGFGIADAYGRGRAMGIGETPFEKFLETEMALTPVD